MSLGTQPSPLNLLEPSALAPDGFVQLFVVTLLNQMHEDFQYASCATVESELRSRGLPATHTRQERRPLVVNRT